MFESNSTHEDDGYLVTRFIRGDVDACAELYNRYIDHLFSYGQSLIGDRALLEDAIQDVFHKILAKPTLLVGGGGGEIRNLKYYLFKMLKNKILDIKKSKYQHNTLHNLDFSLSTFTVEDVTILDDMIEEEERDAIGAKVKQVLDTMTSRQREAVSLRYFHNLDYEEIADLLNMTNAKSARNLVSRAVKCKVEAI